MGKRIAVLVSGRGSNLQSLLDDEDLGGEVVVVVSDRPDAVALSRAADHRIPTAVVALQDHPDRSAWDAAIVDAVASAAPDLVVLAGFMKILDAAFVRRWPTVNVHPALLPAFPGAHAVEDALDWGAKVTGVTVHFVDEQVDHGPIIAQQSVPVAEDDTAATLHARIQALEHQLLPECVRLFCRDRLRVDGRHVRILS